MFFKPSYIEMREGKFLLPKSVKATGASCLCEKIFTELWQSFSFGKSVAEVTPCDDLFFKVGEAECPDLMDFDFAISALPSGIAVVAKNEHELRHAFFTLLDMIKIDEEDDEFDDEDEDYDDFDDDEDYEEGFDFGDEDTTIYEVKCACGNVINFDEDTLEAGSIECSECGELLEFCFDDEEVDD